ncbi:MAG TPA: segregation/condensation protein A [bacterium]|nr:segregation/condensation protein A [bacterium]
MAITITVDGFTGSIDELVEKVRNHAIDIANLDLQSIADQIREQRGEDERSHVDMSDALVGLSDLLARKSKALLPLSEEESEGEEESGMEREVEAYEQYEQLTLYLQELEKKDESSFTQLASRKLEREMDANEFLQGLGLDDLSRALHEVLQRFQPEKENLAFDEHVEREPVTVAEKISSIRELIKTTRKKIAFEQLFAEAETKLEIIVTFLAMLELIKQREIRVEQERRFGPIFLLKNSK